ncbi:MAG: hypothetical protein ACRCZF_19940, partial [Gemmataceae bacterium]
MPKTRIRLGHDLFPLETREVPAAIDPTFGTNGTAYLATKEGEVSASLIPSGQFLVLNNPKGGFGSGELENLSLQRFTSTGDLDTSYGVDGTLKLYPLLLSAWGVPIDGVQDGIRYTPQPSDNYRMAPRLILGPDNKWYLPVTNEFTKTLDAASLSPEIPGQPNLLFPNNQWTTVYKNAIVRFNTDGSLDSTYGENGIAVRKSEYDDAGMNQGIVNDGTEIVVGMQFGPDGSAYLMVYYETDTIIESINVGPFEMKIKTKIQKLLPNGAPDLGFGELGYRSVDTALTTYE